MAIDPQSREGPLAGSRLNGFRRLEEVVDEVLRRLTRDRLKRQRMIEKAMIEKALRARDPHCAPIAENSAARGPAQARPAFKVPDVVQVIPAYRAWRVGCVAGQVRLLALGMNVVWEPRQQTEAKCLRFGFSAGNIFSFAEAGGREHEAPDFCCHCGVWGFKSIEDLLSALGRRYEAPVIGKVSLWGRVIETTNGFRAQYAYPQELWAAGSSGEALGLVYGVPANSN